LKPDQTFLLFHRADLIDILLTRARELGVRVETGTRVTRVDIGHHSTLVEIEGQGARELGFAVGADGLHSLMRAELNGRREPFFTGQAAWRALVPSTGGEPVEARVFMGPRRHLVTYPLRGGAFVNIVAVEEREAWTAEGWFQRDDPANLRRAFARFAPDVQALLGRVEKVHVWGLHRHAVADQWHRGHAVILGDAAHPTLPFMAQGAVMALEDAWVLADSLAAQGLDTGPALYQARRRSRAARVIEAANRNARNYHYANPLARLIGYSGLRLVSALAPGLALGRFDWIYDHDVTRS
jgi:salicylate hydroxylase